MLYAVKFGTGDSLTIHGPHGPVSKKSLRLARVKGGRTLAMEFVMIAEALMSGKGMPAGDIVIESNTVGLSGCEVDDVVALLKAYPERSLYAISCRAAKNYRMDHGMPWRRATRFASKEADGPVVVVLEKQEVVHIEDAEIIYRIATESPGRLLRWTGPAQPLYRRYTSVRPMDKRGYRDERAETFMRLLPPYHELPLDLWKTVGNSKAYSRPMVMPFAMATDEPHLDEGPVEERRQRYKKIIGLYDHGYPSFYRRATVVWMQTVAKQLSGAKRNAEVTPEVRKQAWKITERQILQLFHLTMEHQGR